MSYLKMWTVAIVAAFAAAALITAAPASATVLCKTKTNPCEGRYGTATEVSAHLRPETIAKMVSHDTNYPEFEVECGESTINFKTTNEGGSTQTVTANTEAFTFGNCWLRKPFSSYTPPVLLKKPSLELHWLEAANARITAKGIEFTTSYFGEDCVYGVPGGGSTGIAELRGGKPAQIPLQMELARISGIVCPAYMFWAGEYEVTAPNPLYVAAS